MMRLAYLVGTYPAVSHTFIAREVDELRARGADLYTFSVRQPAPEQLLNDGDLRRAGETRNIQPPSWPAVLRAHSRALRTPRRWVRTLIDALALSPGGAKATVWQAFYFAEAIVMWDWCRQRGTTHIHAHFADSGAWIAMLAAEFGGRDFTFSFTMHGPTEFDDVTRYRLAEKVERAAAVVCISDFCRSQLMRLTAPAHWGKLRIVHCGVDTDVYRPTATALKPTEKLRILNVGRLVPAKGQHVLIAAVARLSELGVAVEAEIVGAGPEREALESAAHRAGVREVIRFVGALAPDQVLARMAACDVFCLPSFAEGVPVVLMEAMAMGKAVLSTRIMGIPELIQDELSGLLVAPGDAEVLAAALARLAADSELRERLGRAGRERVREHYNLSTEADRLMDVFRSVATTRAPG